jgi:SAM-dependent methyltransferase
MLRPRTFILMGAISSAAAVVAVLKHGRRAMGRTVRGGILIRNAAAYDALGHRVLLGSLFDRIAADVAAIATDGARVLEVGCGPGRLSIRLSRRYGLDLDPAMIQRARANARGGGDGDDRRPTFLVGDVASMVPRRIVRPGGQHVVDAPLGGSGGRALVWDFRPGVVPLHRHIPDPVDQMHGSSLRLVTSTPWRWPWRFALTQRVELMRADEEPDHSEV